MYVIFGRIFYFYVIEMLCYVIESSLEIEFFGLSVLWFAF